MEYRPEIPISLGENFLIRDAEEPKPLTAAVIDLNHTEDGEGVWQRVGLRRSGRPRTRFELSTHRRIGYGVYINRDGRYAFLRLTLLPFEELLKYFDNGVRETAEEFIKSNQRYTLMG